MSVPMDPVDVNGKAESRLLRERVEFEVSVGDSGEPVAGGLVMNVHKRLKRKVRGTKTECGAESNMVALVRIQPAKETDRRRE